MNKNRYVGFVLCLLSFVLCLFSCDPRAKWETEEVEIQMNITTVSAGYVECSFSTNKDAYYLVAIEPVRPDYDPMAHQKQFMTLALDSANAEYIQWRYDLLSKGEFSIAPFASHSLQYGSIDHFFTGLTLGTEYWIYAFVVNPDKMTPVGRLYLISIHTTSDSMVDVHFEYRVKGYWDYIYPVDKAGTIVPHFPYMATTRDSADLTDTWGTTPEEYFTDFFLGIAEGGLTADNVRYGVQVVNNNGWESSVEFQAGHTYYTAIVSYDGFLGNHVIYRFLWTGEDFETYLTDEDNIVDLGEDD